MRIEKITRKGKEFAVIPVRDLQRLMDDAEMLADVRAYDAAKSRLDHGEDELIPLEITERRLAGVSMDEALSEGAGATGNRALKQEIFEIREKVMKGEHLSTAFSRSSLFPPRVARWMGIGERVGHVEKVFGQLRAYYQQEVEKWIHRLMTLIEPALIVVLGLLIILFVVFFIVPIFSLYGKVL
jgi:hypothetical protein